MHVNLLLRLRLFGLCLLIALPAFILMYWDNADRRHVAAQTVQDEALVLVRDIAVGQSRLVDEARTLLAALAALSAGSDLQSGEMMPGCQQSLALLSGPPFAFANVGLVSPSGELVCAAVMPENPVNLSDRDFFRRATASRSFASSDYLVDLILGVPVMVFATPILAPEGSIKGLVMTSIELSWLKPEIEAAALPPDSTVIVFDQQGTVLAHYPDSDEWLGLSLLDEGTLVETIIATAGEGTVEEIGLDGITRLASFTRLPGLPESTPVYVTVKIPTAIAYAEANKTWRNNLLWLGITTLIMAIIAWVGGDLLIRRRVRTLVKATKQLAAGDLSIRIGVSKPRDELGELAQTFDQMVASLQVQVEEQRYAEQALRESEAMLGKVLETIPVGVWIHDRAGALIRVNPAGQQLWEGNSSPAAVQSGEHKGWRVATGEPIAPHEWAADRALRSGEALLDEEVEIECFDGSHKVVLASAIPLRDDHNAIIGAIVIKHDISSRRQAEQELREADEQKVASLVEQVAEEKRAAQALSESEALLARVLETIPVGVWIHDRAGALISVNPAGQQLWEDARFVSSDQFGDFKGLRVQKDLPTGLPIIAEEWAAVRAIRNGETLLDEEIKIERFDGTHRVVLNSAIPLRDDKGAIIGAIVASHDITRSRQAEQELRESEMAWRAIFEYTPDLIVMVDRQSTILRINHDAWNRSSEEFIGTSGFANMPAEVQIPLQQAVERVLESGEPESFDHQDREELWWHSRIVSMQPEDQPGLALIITTNITKRKQSEVELRQLASELARSNTELEQFAYVASHDLQEPLRMVSSYLQLLERRYKGKLDSDADEFISYAVDGAKRMQTLIRDLLAYSRVGTRGQPFAAANCEKALQKALSNLSVSVTEAGGQITHDALPVVFGDEGQLVQLFQNLVGNAIKFSDTESPIVHVGVEPGKDEWRFSVRDNGIGIDAKYAERIFVIFQRLHTRDEHPGTGIGLAICKKIVERHGGRIWLESELGHGATFFFTLPRMPIFLEVQEIVPEHIEMQLST